MVLTMFDSFVPDAFFCVAWMAVPDYHSARRLVELPADLSGLRGCFNTQRRPDRNPYADRSTAMRFITPNPD